MSAVVSSNETAVSHRQKILQCVEIPRVVQLRLLNSGRLHIVLCDVTRVDEHIVIR